MESKTGPVRFHTEHEDLGPRPSEDRGPTPEKVCLQTEHYDPGPTPQEVLSGQDDGAEA